MTIDLHDVHTIKVKPGSGSRASSIIIEHCEGRTEIILHSRGKLIEREQTISVKAELSEVPA